MKNPIFRLIYPVLLFSNLSFAYYAPVEQVFIPPGINQNQNMEIYFAGYLPNPCYKPPVVKSLIENENIHLFVNAERKYQENAFCADVIIPFFDHINLGKLNPGDYKLIVNANSNHEHIANFNIENKQSPKNLEFANIVNVNYDVKKEVVSMSGNYENDCYRIVDVKVRDNQFNAYSLFPILKKVKNECSNIQENFNYSFKLKNNLPADKILLHVIVKDGMSVNALFNAEINEEEI